jgi:hypothetical protein
MNDRNRDRYYALRERRERAIREAEVLAAIQFQRQGLTRDEAYRAAHKSVAKDGYPL